MSAFKPPELPSKVVMICVEFDHELSAEELEQVVPLMAMRVADSGVAADLPIAAYPVRVYGGSIELTPEDLPGGGPPLPPPLRPV